MKRFVLNIIYFLVFLVFISFILDKWISNVLRKNEQFAMGDTKLWNDIIHQKTNSDLLIYGSSRAWVHFDPFYINNKTGLSTYNFGVDGQSFDIQKLRHELQLKYNDAPQVIIYSVDINTLSNPKGIYNAEQFLPFLLYNDLIKENQKKYINYSFLDYYLPLWRYGGQEKALKYFMKDILGRKMIKLRDKGFAAQDKEWNQDFDKAKNKAIVKPIDKYMVNQFDKFLVASKNSGISVILVYAPEYYLGQQLVGNRNEIINVFDSLSTKNNIPFLDYSKDSINYNKGYFYNSLHMNKNGVEVFNQIYINDIKAIVSNSSIKERS